MSIRNSIGGNSSINSPGVFSSKEPRNIKAARILPHLKMKGRAKSVSKFHGSPLKRETEVKISNKSRFYGRRAGSTMFKDEKIKLPKYYLSNKKFLEDNKDSYLHLPPHSQVPDTSNIIPNNPSKLIKINGKSINNTKSKTNRKKNKFIEKNFHCHRMERRSKLLKNK